MAKGELEFKKVAKAHTRYYLADGTRVPGVTTILGILDKPALKFWANKIGLQGIEIRKYTDAAASVGTLAHYLIQCYLAGEAADTSDYSRNEIERAENAVLKFLAYTEEHVLEPVLLEAPLVSEEYRFGGTVDFYGFRDEVPCVIDFKTGNALYPDNLHQAVAYRQLVIEAGHPVEAVHILRIGRDESEGFEERKVGNLEAHWRLFELCREAYDVRKVAK